MRRLVRRLASAALVAVLLAALTPGVAVAVGTVGGTVRDAVTIAPLVGAQVDLFETNGAGLVRVDRDWTNGVGIYGPLNANDAFSATYRARTSKPGYITKDDPVPPTPGWIIGGGFPYNPQLTPDPLLTERSWGNDRYSTAVQVARERFTSPDTPNGWWGVETVVIASGEDRAAADPLAAAGLCGAYGDTPLFLVSSTMVPSSVKQAIAEISTTLGGPIKVVIVGGTTSVPPERLAEIAAAAPNGAVMDRIIATGDRFDLAAAIAMELDTIWGGPTGLALIANGADPEKFFDPLALSTISAGNGLPILLVNEDSIPAATRNYLDSLPTVPAPVDLIIGGGPATVSDGVMAELDTRYGTGLVERWWGPDRYSTAVAIADNAIAQGFLDGDIAGVAAKLPDALTGGATIGQGYGVLLITDGENLTPVTRNWLTANKATVDKCYVVGGPVSVTPGVMNAVNASLQ